MGEGILFIEADADVSIEQHGDSILPPCPSIEELVYDVPGSSGILGCPLLLIQVTRLTCGGFIVAIRLNHTMCDSSGLAKFLKATGEIGKRSKNTISTPCLAKRNIMCKKSTEGTCIHHEYEDSNSKKTLNLDQPNMVHRSFFFRPREIKSITNHLPPHLRNSSTYEVLTSCLWKCRTLAFQLDPNEIVSLSCITSVHANQCMQLPDGFYGNSFIFPAVLSNVGLLCKNPLVYALELVKNCRNTISEVYIRSVIDLLVIKGKPHFTKGFNFLSVDTTNSGLAEIDFGWGNPVYAGPTGAFLYISIFARFKNSEGEDGISFPIWLPEPVMQRFQDELMKLTSQ